MLGFNNRIILTLKNYDLDEQPEVGRGDLTYSMVITAGALGGTTTVEITPNHNVGEVGARLVGLNKSSC